MPITFGCIMRTKGGNYFRLKGKHLSITLAAIIGITILLWAWEKTPLVTSLLSDQDQFVMPSSDILMGLPADPLIPTKPEEHIKEDSSDLVMSAKRRNEPNEEYSSDLKPRETESEQTAESFHIAPTDNASTSFHKRRQDDMATFSAENEESTSKKESDA